VLALCLTGEAKAEVVKGQSRDLGIQFEVVGGENWCRPDVAVALTAAKPDAFKPEGLPFVQMLGRIRAIVMHQCPLVERIAFDGVSEQRTVLSIEMTRLTRWRRMFPIDPKTRRPLCPGQGPAATECGKRADAYLIAHKLIRGDRFVDSELTAVLEESDESHAVWISGNVVGKLTIRERSEFAGRYASSGELAAAIVEVIGNQCSRDGAGREREWSQTWSRGAPYEVAARGLSCRPTAGEPNHYAVLVTSVGPRFHVFAMLASGKDADSAKAVATILALAMDNPR
jgi:hypothetical protein